MTLKLMTVIASCALLFACGKEDKKENSEPPLPIYEGPSFSLKGVDGTTWTGECIKSKNFENRSYQVIVTFKEPRFEVLSNNFEGVICDPNNRILSIADRFYSVKNDDVSSLAGWTTMAYYVEAIEMTLHKESFALSYNAEQRYGYNNWTPGVANDITGRRFSAESEPEHQKNTVRERTYQIVDETLYFATYASGTAQPSTEFPYKLNK